MTRKLYGKTCLVTGANSGLGFAVAKQFTVQGAETIMVCRNKLKGEKAVADIKRDNPGALLELMICDLSSMTSIRKFVAEFSANHSKLDILFNNAAVMKQKRTITEDGHEMMFQVNYLAPFILMNSFLDLLKKGTSPIIINNGRPADKLRLDMDDLQFTKKYSMYNSFFKTKLYLILTTLQLAGRSERNGITVTMIDPGPFKSDLVRDVPLAGWVKNLFSSGVDKAAENILYHATDENIHDKNGKIYKEKLEWPVCDYWRDENIGADLWAVTESLIGGKMD